MTLLISISVTEAFNDDEMFEVHKRFAQHCSLKIGVMNYLPFVKVGL